MSRDVMTVEEKLDEILVLLRAVLGVTKGETEDLKDNRGEVPVLKVAIPVTQYDKDDKNFKNFGTWEQPQTDKAPATFEDVVNYGGDTFMNSPERHNLHGVVSWIRGDFNNVYMGVGGNEYFTLNRSWFKVSRPWRLIGQPIYLDGDSDSGIKYNGVDDHIAMFLGSYGNETMLWQDDAMYMKEIATPPAVAAVGALYPKNDDKLYFLNSSGVELEIAFVP